MELIELKRRMHAQEVYVFDEALAIEQAECLERLYDFNQTRPSEYEKRINLLQQIFAEMGERCCIEPPL